MEHLIAGLPHAFSHHEETPSFDAYLVSTQQRSDPIAGGPFPDDRG